MAVAVTARDHAGMSLEARTEAARLVLVERRDTVAPRDPSAARVRRYRLARVQLGDRTAPPRVGARSWGRCA
ncbi:MAG: hypothetical protein QOF04_1835 [Solirubrobacteraceae bacterium]|nr:hypothetical protein [Solirubrobacteraceae bacterium]